MNRLAAAKKTGFKNEARRSLRTGCASEVMQKDVSFARRAPMARRALMVHHYGLTTVIAFR